MSVSRIVAMGALLLAAAPVAAAQPPDDVGEIDDYPIAQGTVTTPDLSSVYGVLWLRLSSAR
jgi:hypothetical protein